METIPNDAICYIFDLIPLEDLFSNVYRVCKRWYMIYRDERFWKRYLKLEINPTRKSWRWFAKCNIIINSTACVKPILGRLDVLQGIYYGTILPGTPSDGIQRGYGYLITRSGTRYEGEFVNGNLINGIITYEYGEHVEFFGGCRGLGHRVYVMDFAHYEKICPDHGRYIEYGSYRVLTGYSHSNFCYYIPPIIMLRYGKRSYSDGRTMLLKRNQQYIYTWPDGSVYRGSFSLLDNNHGSDFGFRSGKGKMRWPVVKGQTIWISWKGKWNDDNRLDDRSDRRCDGFFLLSEDDQYERVQEEMARLQ